MLRKGRIFSRHSRGVTLIEMVAIIGVVVILSLLTFAAFRSLNSREALETDTGRIQTELNRARSLTLGSKNAAQFGLHIASTSVTQFTGSSYVAGSSTNVTTYLTPSIRITSITLNGGGSDVIFDRLTGKTTSTGTLVVQTLDASQSRTITIYATGLSDIR